MKDPGGRILEPSDQLSHTSENPEDAKVRSFVEPTPPRLVLEIPARVKSFEEPTKKQLIHDPYVRNCVNCEGRFRLRTMRLGGKLCANCFKIHESVSRTV